jgi:hypothetical protein
VKSNIDTRISAQAVAHVRAKIAPPDPTTGCWLWLGARSRAGYGCVRCGRVIRGAHRVVFEMFRGPIPEALPLDHLCRVRNCVCPQHLEVVTQAENNIRAGRIRRLARIAA